MRPLVLILLATLLWYGSTDGWYDNFFMLFCESGGWMALITTLCIAAALGLAGIVLAIVQLCHR